MATSQPSTRVSTHDKLTLRYQQDRDIYSYEMMNELDLGTPTDVRMFPTTRGLQPARSRSIPIVRIVRSASDMALDQGEELAKYHDYVMTQRVAGAMFERNANDSGAHHPGNSSRGPLQYTAKTSFARPQDSLQQLVMMGRNPKASNRCQFEGFGSRPSSNRDGFMLAPRLGWQDPPVPREDDSEDEEGVFELDL